MHVRLSDGTTLEADIAVVGVGTEVNVEWLLQPATRGWIRRPGRRASPATGPAAPSGSTPRFGRVYALGDVAAWHDASHDRHLRFEHWTTAVDQAPVLARALVRDLAGEPPEPTEPLLPYFWSDQFGRKVQLLGRPGLADSVELLHGEEPADPDEPAPRKLLVGYFAGDQLVAIAGISAPALLGATGRC